MRNLLIVLALAGCGNDVTNPNADMAQPDMARGPDLSMPLPMGDPIQAPMNQWTWVDFPDSACQDGAAAGIGVYPTGSDKLIIFLNGGGACWSYLTCYTLMTATTVPAKDQFTQLAGTPLTGTVFDQNEAKNPFKGWNAVFVPYCTGDVHSGNHVSTYTDMQSGMTKTWHHVGHANIMAYLKRLAPTFPNMKKVVVSGSSAGGFGASLNYQAFREYFPSSQDYLLDDSGPPLEAPNIPQGYIDAWYQEWGLGQVLDPVCGDPCKTDLSQALKVLDATYPNDRMALLSSLQDQTIRGYFLLSPSGFQTALLMTATDLLDPTPNFRYFFVPGQTHTMLGGVNNFTVNNVSLWDWMNQMVTDDPSWKSQKP